MNKIFGIDLEKRFKTIFEHLSGLTDSVPNGIFDKDSFLIYSIRILFPEKGGLPIHTDDEFPSVTKLCGSYLSTLTKCLNHSSFFFFTGKSEQGRNLIFYGSGADQGQNVPSNKDDLIIFRSQFIKHCVSSPIGLKNRITISGFTGLRIEGSTVFFWS